jgi:hypothetical protein
MTSLADSSAWRRPTAWSGLLFHAKVAALRLRRAVRDAGDDVRRFERAPPQGFEPPARRLAHAADLRPAPAGGRLPAGKVENLRQAARRLDGVAVPAGGRFSFWRQLGPATGRVASWSGACCRRAVWSRRGRGLCQLSNALFEVALGSGCEIVERHAHSRTVPGSAAALGRDATVAWNYVDFRFRARRSLRLSVSVTGDELVVALCGRAADGPPDPGSGSPAPATASVEARTCATCDEAACPRHEADPPR